MALDTPDNLPKPPRLLDQLRDRLRVKHYSLRTEAQYTQWVRRFILFHDKRHPRELGVKEVEAFLTHRAVEGHVAVATQNQALSALLFLYREVLEMDFFRTIPLPHIYCNRIMTSAPYRNCWAMPMWLLP